MELADRKKVKVRQPGQGDENFQVTLKNIFKKTSDYLRQITNAMTVR